LPPPSTKATHACREKHTANPSLGLKFQPDSSFQHINPARNFYLTKNQFYSPIFKNCEAFHGSIFAGLKIIRFLLLLSPERDFVSLIGLLIALIVTLSITSVAGSAQQMIISALYLDYIEWLKPAWRGIGLAMSIFANYLLFFWIFWRLPRHRPRKKALIRGTLIAAIGFEVIKIVMTYTLPSLVKSPSGAAFGSVLGLMAFFYFFARLTLFCAAWIATAEYKGDTRMPGKTHR
jgi:hypothetical protein